MKAIDLRSDTVTKPCDNMRQAIFSAAVGDDVVAEDPSVNELQQLAIEISGKEAALFVPSATMANQLAVKGLTSPGDAIATLKNAHLYRYESGMSSILSQVTILAVGDNKGCITTEEIEGITPPDDPHFPPLKVVCVENTHYGHVVPLEAIERLSQHCRKREILMHLDGARLFNASVASGVSIKEYAKHFATVTLCLSKGLGAPVGALICCDNKYLKKIHRFRKALGGGMRQAGIVAAAGIYALQNNVNKLQQDHENARFLAEELQKMEGVKVTNLPIATNMVFADFSAYALEQKKFLEHMSANNIFMYFDENQQTTRLVTHLDLDKEDILVFCRTLANYFSNHK